MLSMSPGGAVSSAFCENRRRVTRQGHSKGNQRQGIMMPPVITSGRWIKTGRIHMGCGVRGDGTGHFGPNIDRI